VAMFLVGGGIVVHGIELLHHWSESLAAGSGSFAWLVPSLFDGVVGIVAGSVALLLVSAVQRLRKKKPDAAAKA
jgi:predicted DNA repair protein MutK